MTNLTVDPSVFALPAKSVDLDKEYNNLIRFISNVNAIRMLEECPTVTINYVNRIKKRLGEYDYCCDNDLKKRIELLKNNETKTFNFSMPIKEIIEYYDENISKKLSITDPNNNSRGIYINIPENEDIEYSTDYNKVIYDRYVYPSEFSSCNNLKGVFKKYLGFIAKLNYDYLSKNENYIVISGKKYFSPEVTMCFNENKKSKVNVIGVQKAIKLINRNEYISNIIQEISTINKEYNKYLIFGNDVSFNNIKGGNKEFVSTRIFQYIKNLNNIVNIILEKNISDDHNLIFLLNAHGCLCSPENDIYNGNKCRYRVFKDNENNELFFSIHLKPITETASKTYTYTLGGLDFNYTCRIYFMLKNNKILIGWIGKHPLSCDDCIDKPQCMKNHNN